MADDLHFLERLDRVASDQAELALTLYRDSELVSALLADTRLPPGAPRVALALDASPEPPHVIVDRASGAFVTCLASGMRLTDDLPVITRAQLDGATVRLERLRQARALAADLPHVRRQFQHLLTAAESLSREDLQLHLDLAPLLGDPLLQAWSTVNNDAVALRATLKPVVGKTPTPADRDRLQHFYQRAWALAHLTVLVAAAHPTAFDHPINAEALPKATLHLHVLGPWALGVRAVWAAARVGKPVLPAYKSGLIFTRNVEDLFNRHLTLGAIALRHASLRAEVVKALTLSATGATPSDLQVPIRYAAEIRRVIAHPDANYDTHRREALARASALLAAQAGVRLLRPDQPPDLPEPLALTLSAQALDIAKGTSRGGRFAGLHLPWLARAAPQDLYLPASHLHLVRRRFTPDLAFQLLPTLAHLKKHAPQPTRAAPKVPRNAPCPCSSGKKHKHCCGA